MCATHTLAPLDVLNAHIPTTIPMPETLNTSPDACPTEEGQKIENAGEPEPQTPNPETSAAIKLRTLKPQHQLIYNPETSTPIKVRTLKPQHQSR
jgi:hypothetical protein